MRRGKWSVVVSVLLLIDVSLPLAAKGPPAVTQTIGGSHAPPLRMPDGFFTENAGQVSNEQVRFYSTGDMQFGFAESAVLVKLVERDNARPLHDFEDLMRGPQVQRDNLPPSRGVMVSITFPGSNEVTPLGVQEMPHRSNYFIGNDPSKWRTSVRSYREIVYRDLYDGIDLSYRTQDGQLKYEFIVSPEADPALITMSYEGVEGLHVDRSGELVVSTALGELRDGMPIAFQDGRQVECAFVQRGMLSFGFGCDGRNPSRPLVIDPLVYATFLGGGGGRENYAFGIAADSSGNAYVTGDTSSIDFPATPGSFDTTFDGVLDAFVVKLNAAGSALVYATALGGIDGDYGYGIAIDSSGNAYVTGWTSSADFPVTPGSFDTTFDGLLGDAFVAELNAAGNALIYATFLGGGDHEEAFSIAIDSSGSAYVSGNTRSADFPTTPGSFDTSFNGVSDAFAVKLDASGTSLVYASFLGGGISDWGYGIDVDSLGNAYVFGDTESADFPATPGSFETTLNGVGDAFVAKLDATGSTLVYATFLGGGGGDWGNAIAVDSSGSVFVTGYTDSTDFPATPGSFDTTYGGGTNDAFVAGLNAAGDALIYATYLGGVDHDWGMGIAVDSSGSACVTGYTSSADFPSTPNSFDTTLDGIHDAFVVKLDATGSALDYASFLGGGDSEAGISIFVDSADSVYVTGYTISADFPATLGSFDTIYNGGITDAFVAKLNLISRPVLSATGEPNYVSDGLHPETGSAGVTSFEYRVKYTHADNDTPLAGDPKLYISKGGVEITGSPFTMAAVDPADTTYTDGKLYTYSTTLSPRGTDYTYYFSASDDTGNAATDWPNPPADAPDVLNRGPTADAGSDQPGRLRNEVVYLNGTGSTDPDGDALAFSWTQTAGPTVVLTGGNTATPSFTPTVAGTYTFDLTVNDGFAGGTDVDTVTVTVVNRHPVADAGGPYTCKAGETITLNGSGSTDPDGDVLIYQWTVQLATVITLSGQKPTFTCPGTEGMFTVSLNVTDPGSLSGTDDAQLSIQPKGGEAADWTWLIVVAIAVVAVLLILFLLIRRKKRGEEINQQEKPSESPPKSPS